MLGLLLAVIVTAASVQNSAGDTKFWITSPRHTSVPTAWWTAATTMWSSATALARRSWRRRQTPYRQGISRAATALGGDSLGAQASTALVIVVGAIGVDASRTAVGKSSVGHVRHGIKRGLELCDVVAVAAGERGRRRDSAAFGQDVVLGALAAVRSRQAGLNQPVKLVV